MSGEIGDARKRLQDQVNAANNAGAVAASICDHYWAWVSPAGTRHSARLCMSCHAPDPDWLNEVHAARAYGEVGSGVCDCGLPSMHHDWGMVCATGNDFDPPLPDDDPPPCGSCGEPSIHRIILRGEPMPVCLRHLNHWRTPAGDTPPEPDQPHGEIVAHDMNGYTLYVCADCGQNINNPKCPARHQQPNPPSFDSLLHDPTQQLDPNAEVLARVIEAPDTRSEVETLDDAPCICASSFGHWHREDMERVAAARERAAEARALEPFHALAGEHWDWKAGQVLHRRLLDLLDRADRIEGTR